MIRARGFTLFEILVAVSIFAVMGTISMSNLIQVGRTGEQVTQVQQQLAEIQFALGYIGKDLAQLSDRKVRDQYGDEQPQFEVVDNRVVFTRAGWSNLLQQPRSSLQRVEYRLQDENLQRRFWPQLDQPYIESSVEQVLLHDVEDLRIRLLTNGDEKLDSWPPDAQTQSTPPAPVALEMTLELEDFGQVQRVYELSNAIQ